MCTITSGSGSLVIRACAPGELHAVRELHGTVFGEKGRELLEQRFFWQFEGNPAARSVPSAHLVAVLNGRIVGALSSFPARIKLDDRVETILVPCDLLVAPEGRGHGLGQKLLDAHRGTCGELSIALAYTPWIIHLYEKLGYARLPAEPHYSRPVNLAAWSASQVRRRLGDARGLARVAQAAAKYAGAAASLPLEVVNALRRPADSAGVRVSAADRADARFDAIWRRVAPGIPGCFVRDSSFVGWRYFEDPASRHTLLIAQDPLGEALGFLAYRLRKRSGVRCCQIMDVFCEPAAPHVARQLVRECLRREEQGVDVFACKGLHPAIRSVVQEALYVDKAATSLPAMVSWRGGTAGPERLREAGAWHLAHADGDEDFSP